MCSEFQVRYYLSTSSVSLICFNLLANKMLADLVFFTSYGSNLIQQHFSCYCYAILGTASIYSYLLCFAQNEIATIAPLPPYRNGILDGAWWTIITLVLLPHLMLHYTFSIWVLHIPLLKLDPLSKRDNHRRTWVIQFDCQNWLHWKINQAQWAIFLHKRARIVVSIGNRIDCLYWLIAKKELPGLIKQLWFDFLSCNWSNQQAIFAIEE
jgi:glycosyltransferase involved in cell wall biosynthesis